MLNRNILEKIITALRVPDGPSGRVLVGFDGYVDRIVRLKKNQRDPPDYFESIGEFTDFLRKYPDKSVDIGLRRINEKIGGNGPILAESLAAKNVNVYCIGAFGYPEILDVFKPLANMCSLVSVEQAAFTLAMEFNNAKIMLGENDSFDNITWDRLKEIMGEEDILKKINESEIFCFTNWSGLSKSNDILEGLVKYVYPGLNSKKVLFFDLSDPSCKTVEQFDDFFKLLTELSGSFDITLGLNTKEMLLVYNRFFQSDEENYSDNMVMKLVEAMPVKEILVHGTDWAAASERTNKFTQIKGTKITNPRYLTGAGDNFNAGFCLGKLCNLDLTACLYLGNISAFYYVKTGIPAVISDIAGYIENELKTFDQ
ncbi:MAG: hypothetical protein LBH07_05560 [Treponema sp.]|jgi:hypothetical protein|nr:hypothetical protein [Treponema sp.]